MAEQDKKCGSRKYKNVWDGRRDYGDDASYAFIPSRALRDDGFTKLHFRTLGHIGLFNHKKGSVRISQKDLAQRFGVRREFINRVLKQLVKWGYLEKQSQAETGESFCHYRMIMGDKECADQVHTGVQQEVTPAVDGECAPQVHTAVQSKCTGVCTTKHTHIDHIDEIDPPGVRASDPQVVASRTAPGEVQRYEAGSEVFNWWYEQQAPNEQRRLIEQGFAKLKPCNIPAELRRTP